MKGLLFDIEEDAFFSSLRKLIRGLLSVLIFMLVQSARSVGILISKTYA